MRKIKIHAGIIVCKGGGDLEELANNINDAIYTAGTLTGKLIRVYRLPPHSTSNSKSDFLT